MKNLFYLFASLIIFSSCHKKDEPEPIVPPCYFFKCNINDTINWKSECDKSYADFISTDLKLEGFQLADSLKRRLFFRLENRQGIHNVGPGQYRVIYVEGSSFTDLYDYTKEFISDSGVVNITKYAYESAKGNYDVYCRNIYTNETKHLKGEFDAVFLR